MWLAVVRNERSEPGALAQNARRLRKRRMKSPIRVLLVGAAGRIGKTVLDLAAADPKIDIVAQCDLGDPIESAMKNCDVVVDISHAAAIEEICRAASQPGKWLLIG